MPRAFSEAEQVQIRNRLIAAGKRQISALGIRRLVIDEVTREAGISKGSFYSFFPSREDFILSVFEAWEGEFRSALLREVAESGESPRKRIERLILGAFAVFRREPGLLRIRPRDIEDLALRLPPERLAAHQAADRDVLEHAFAAWETEGLVAPAGRDALPALIPLIFAMALHRDDFPADSFEPMTRLLASSLAAKLAPSTGEPHENGS
ncbi:MAG TPA: TetR/AcrR family transcriptional regulator [Rectinemataceae bacterium]|nr:TetR/AcrR family transcriptional regulator [Rectinemataceae bacterium]